MGATWRMQLKRSCKDFSQEELEKKKLLSALNQAQKEYNVALSHFHAVTEPEIIDEAIYRMEAARKKYSFFLKRVRQ